MSQNFLSAAVVIGTLRVNTSAMIPKMVLSNSLHARYFFKLLLWYYNIFSKLTL